MSEIRVSSAECLANLLNMKIYNESIDFYMSDFVSRGSCESDTVVRYHDLFLLYTNILESYSCLLDIGLNSMINAIKSLKETDKMTGADFE